MPPHTLSADFASPATLKALDNAAQTLPHGEARDALAAVTQNLREGSDVVFFRADNELTPAQVARILGVSRTHVYKVLDSGALPFHTVGTRDRRVKVSDLKDYAQKADQVQRAASQRLVNARDNRARAINEMS